MAYYRIIKTSPSKGAAAVWHGPSTTARAKATRSTLEMFRISNGEIPQSGRQRRASRRFGQFLNYQNNCWRTCMG